MVTFDIEIRCHSNKVVKDTKSFVFGNLNAVNWSTGENGRNRVNLMPGLTETVAQ